MLDIYYLRESSETWEISDQKLRRQRIRARSWEWWEGSLKERQKMLQKSCKSGSWRKSGVKCRNNT